MREVRKHNADLKSGPYVLADDEPGEFLLLKDMFEFAPQQLIAIELKGSNIEIIQIVGDIIKKYNRQSITIWGCHAHQKLLKQLYPDISQWHSVN